MLTNLGKIKPFIVELSATGRRTTTVQVHIYREILHDHNTELNIQDIPVPDY